MAQMVFVTAGSKLPNHALKTCASSSCRKNIGFSQPLNNLFSARSVNLSQTFLHYRNVPSYEKKRRLHDVRSNSEETNADVHSDLLRINDALIEENERGQKSSSVDISQTTLIWRAVKLPLYTVALIPLMVGSAAAYLETGVFKASRFWSFLLFSVLVIAWLNLSNDAFDAETGVDKEKKESVVNLTGSRIGVLFAAFSCLAVGLYGIIRGALAVGDFRVGTFLLISIACGYVYQCPPFRLSYLGLGEPLCFIAFGPFATTAFYLYQASSPGINAIITPAVLSASVLVGITTSLILFCSHFHQIEGDLATGKISPLVRLGTSKGSKVVKFVVGTLYALTLGFVALQFLPLSCLVGALLTAPIGKLVVDFVTANHENKKEIFMAKYFCVRLHTLFGVLLSAGLALGRNKIISF